MCSHFSTKPSKTAFKEYGIYPEIILLRIFEMGSRYVCTLTLVVI